eukprot:TRINITY_DN4025_c0_g1_i1.p1 TRINITY_DN4025_c0_g1~~TRINITY_DN4025_c0_g1_i1.p1  ORF type:complete len:1168 (-),score=196.86 TRINITY_DN4025_c0_g1_i1:32-3535(-)
MTPTKTPPRRSPLLLALALLFGVSCISGLSFTGNTTYDFENIPNTYVFYDSGNQIASVEALAGALTEPNTEEITDVSWAGLGGPLTNRSGWDMRAIILNYDMKYDLLHVGIQFYARAGDADGDGNGATFSDPLSLDGALDLPNMTFSESIFLLVDPTHSNSSNGGIVRNFQPRWLLGKPPSDQELPFVDGAAIYMFVNMTSNGTHVDINYLEATGIASSLISLFSPPDVGPEQRLDVEFDIANFSSLPGIHRDVNGDLAFSFAAVSGSNADALIEYDLIPNYFLTFNESEALYTAEIVGITARFPCPTALDPFGACCLHSDKDLCGVCFGGNRNMSSCGICFGPTVPESSGTACPGIVESVQDLNLVERLNLDPSQLFIIENLGDIDGNGIEDLAIGIPGLPRGNSSWDCSSAESSCSVGSVRLLLMAGTPSALSVSKVIFINSSAANFSMSNSDLFGFSIQVLTINSLDGSYEIAIGAPGVNNGTGAMFLVALDRTGTIRTFRRLTPDGLIISSVYQDGDQVGRSTVITVSDALGAARNFGAQIGSMTYQGSRVLLISTPRYLLSPQLVSSSNISSPTNGSDSYLGGLYLAVVGSGSRILGLRGFAGANVTLPLVNITGNPFNGSEPLYYSPSFALAPSSSGDISALALAMMFQTSETESVMFPVDDKPLVAYMSVATGTITQINVLSLRGSLENELQTYNVSGFAELSDSEGFFRRGTAIQHLDSLGDVFGDGMSDLIVALPYAFDSVGAIKLVNLAPPSSSSFSSSNSIISIAPGLARMLKVLPPRSRFGFSLAKYSGLVSSGSSGMIAVTNPDGEAPRALFLSLRTAPQPPRGPSTVAAAPKASTPSNSPLPFSFPPSSTVIIDGNRTNLNTSFPPRADFSPGPITVSFIDGAPILKLSPQSLSGDTPSVIVRMIALDEVTAAGVRFRSFEFPTTGSSYSSTKAGETSWTFSTSAPSVAASIDYTALLLLEEKVVSFNNDVFFRVDPNTVKFTLRVANWQFANVTNFLVFRFILEQPETIFSTDDKYSATERLTRFSLRTKSSEIRISVPHFALVDGVTTSIQQTFSRTSAEFQLRIPSFKTFIEYDPDVSILDSSSSDPVVNSGGNTTLWRLLIGIGGGLAGLVMILIIVCLVRRYKRNQAQEKRWRQAAELQRLSMAPKTV